VEQQWFIRIDQILVEGETVRRHPFHEGGKAIDATGNFIDTGLHRTFSQIFIGWN
jgi:hypothetical protein